MTDLFTTIATIGVVPVIAIESIKDAFPLADALKSPSGPMLGATLFFRPEAQFGFSYSM